jgi:hypothetical protein
MGPDDLCAAGACPVVHFMIHDRAAFGGALFAVGALYAWFTAYPLAAGERWAWWTLHGHGGCCTRPPNPCAPAAGVGGHGHPRRARHPSRHGSYTDALHVAPAWLGAAAAALGLALTAPAALRRPAPGTEGR